METNTYAAMLEKEFRIYIDKQPSSSYRVQVSDLLDAEKVGALIQDIKERFHAPSKQVVASLFAKRFMLFPMGILWSMTRFRQTFSFSLSSLSLYVNEKNVYAFYVEGEPTIETVKGTQEEWRADVVRHLFADVIYPFFQALHVHTGISLDILWGHMSYLLYYYYEQWIKEATSPEEKITFMEDFWFLTEEASPALFGEVTINPLRAEYRMVPHPADATKEIRIRNKCCFNYRLPEGRCCYTCPRLTEEERTRQILSH
jgi:ferric iron reductase protein FhuF